MITDLRTVCQRLCLASAVALAACVFTVGGYAAATQTGELAPPPWVVECIECSHLFSDLAPQAAQIDSKGVIHVVYGGEALYHAWQSTGGWQVEIADPMAGVGRYTALAIDSSDRLHVIYYDDNSRTLRYAVKLDGGWRLESIGPTILETNPYPTIGVGASGRPQAAYYRPSDGDLYYLLRTDSDWQATRVDSEGDVGAYASLAVDKHGDPHIAYYDATHGDLRYAVSHGGVWTTATAAAEDDVGAHATLALDGNGFPHIVAQRSQPYLFSQVIYVAQDAAGWHLETVQADCQKPNTSVVGCGLHAVVRLDAVGHARIAYYNLRTNIVPYPLIYTPTPVYAEHTTSGWVLDENNAAGTDTLLVLDGAGVPHVLAVDSMLLAEWVRVPGSWQKTNVDQGGDPGAISSLAVDMRNRVHVTTRDPAREAYVYGLRTGTGWAITPFARSIAVTGRTSLGVDPAGWPRFLFDRYSRTSRLNYAEQFSGGWQIASDFGAIAPYYALAVDANGVSHLVYFWLGVQYETRPATGERVTIDSQVGAPADIAVDRSGTPHVAYIDALSHALKHGSVRDGHWFTETAATLDTETGNSGTSSVAIAVDADGQPQIAFAEHGSYIWLAIHSNAGWRRELVAYAPDDPELDLAVDGLGRAFISYYDKSQGNLKLARFETGQAPLVLVLDSEGDVGRGSSIALDIYGQPHISYYDATHHDLKQAYIPFMPANFAYLPVVGR